MNQVFNGITFRKNVKGYYVSDHNKGVELRMHRVVWEHYNGPIPEGYIVHHKDRNKGNNEISNLEMMTVYDHAEEHRKDAVENRSAIIKEFKCEQCQNFFLGKHIGRTARFCSTKCGTRYRYVNKIYGWVTNKCIICSKEYVSRKHKYVKTCSDPCRVALIKLSRGY